MPEQNVYAILLYRRDGNKQIALGEEVKGGKPARFTSIDDAVKEVGERRALIVTGGFDFVKIAPVLPVGYGRSVMSFQVAAGRVVKQDWICEDARYN